MSQSNENISTRRVLIEKNERFYIFIASIPHSSQPFPMLVMACNMDDLKEAKILYEDAYRHYRTHISERMVISDNPNEYYKIVDERFKNNYLANLINVSICTRVNEPD